MTVWGIIHHPVLSLKHDISETGSVFVFRWNLLGWAQQKKLVSLSGLAFLFGPLKDIDRIQSPKRRVFK
jgi:hypothetical protein